VRTLLAKPALEAASARRGRGLLGAYATTVGLTLTNPATIISFAAVFAGLGLANAAGSTVAAPGLLTLGVLLGSACWWLLLSGGVSLLRSRLTTGALRWVNRLSGVILLVFGVAALLSGIMGR
jgi:threonine/homoserine/homoserine lactone efflux protein